MARIVLFANTDWYLYNFRLSLAERLRAQGDEVLLVSPPGEYGGKLLEKGFRWTALPMKRRSLNSLRELGVLAALARLLHMEKPDLVHSFTIKCAVYGALAARAVGVRAQVSSVTGMGYVFTSDEPRARRLAPVVRQLIRLSVNGAKSRVILQNPDDLAMFTTQRLADPARLRLIPSSGVDCERFNAQPPERRSSEPLRVVLAARLLWDKGLVEFVEAARALKAEGRDIRFLLAGEPDPGNPAAVPLKTIKAWAGEGVIEWLGHVEDMPGLLKSAHVVVLPSYREGLPKTLIEAAACARALITTDAPGCREVVTHEVDGLLIPVRQAKPLAEAIARLHDDPALAHRLGVAAREKALATFDQTIVLRRTLAVYQELLV